MQRSPDVFGYSPQPRRPASAESHTIQFGNGSSWISRDIARSRSLRGVGMTHDRSHAAGHRQSHSRRLNRAGPSTLVRAGGQTFLVDCGRGVQQRAAAVGVRANGLAALLLTHLHSDHIADLGDVIITRWVTTFDPNPAPLPIIGPARHGRGRRRHAEDVRARHRLPDRSSRRHHRAAARRGARVHRRCGVGPRLVVANLGGADRSPAGDSDHRVPDRTRGASVVSAGDTVPCASASTSWRRARVRSCTP